jgi:AMP deaminase
LKGRYKAWCTESLNQHISDLKARKTFTKVPEPREYFSDLDFVLGVISDGPTKSFAFRRLRYLESKWNLYVLLNEYQELAESKV